MQGQSQLLMGEIQGGRTLLVEALADLEVAHLRALVFTNLALADIADGEWGRAEVLVDQDSVVAHVMASSDC